MWIEGESEKGTVAEASVGALSLQDSLARALEKNPELATYPVRIRACEARLLQAGLRVNPELGVEFEDFAGSGPNSGFGGMQATVRMSQVIELGGKRAVHRGVAASELELENRTMNSRA